MDKFFRILLPVLFLGLAIGIAAVFMLTKPDPPTRTPPAPVAVVDAVRLKLQDYRVIIPSQGTVKPRTESTLRPQVSGRILRISPSFRDGGFFEEGDVLLNIDPRDYETAVVVAEARLAQMNANLELEKAQHAQALENWKQLGDGSAPSPLTLREPQLAEARAGASSAEARLEEAKRNLERTRIKAPYAGRILKKEVDVGQYVAPGNLLASVFAVDYVEVRLPLRNEHLDYIDLPEEYRGDDGQDESHAAPGPKVLLHGRLGSRDVTWPGIIVRAEGAYDAKSRELFVVAQVHDPYARHGTLPPLKVGQFVTAAITGKTLKDVFVITRSAVRGGREVLIVDEEQKVHRRPVHMIWKDERHAVIRDNLKPGEILCTTPLSFAVDGVIVKPQIEGEKPAENREIGSEPKTSSATSPAGRSRNKPQPTISSK